MALEALAGRKKLLSWAIISFLSLASSLLISEAALRLFYREQEAMGTTGELALSLVMSERDTFIRRNTKAMRFG